ncbi:MAG: flagellar hook-associated family protein [Aquamicrobium sp.]|nr:flagellar hook-associated family protein [Aquamicrobium sp.]
MKVSFVSSQAITQALRYQTSRIQGDLNNALKEMNTLRVADTGLALGARTSVSVSLHREIDRLNSLIDSNKLAASRLEMTQIGLRQLSDAASDLLADYSTALSDTADPAITRQQAEKTLALMSSVLNANVNGENIFAGINTDVKPFNDFLDPTSPNRIAFDTAFQTHFGFAADAPAAANITGAQMDAFLTAVESQFLGADWHGSWSEATDQQITSRITLTETAQTSVSANIVGFRKLAMAAATVVATFSDTMSKEGRDAVLDRAFKLVGEVIPELANQQGYTGIAEQRLTSANDRMSMQIDLFTKSIQDLEGIDELNAASRVTGLKTQLEISYQLTASMQQLSLLKYLS